MSRYFNKLTADEQKNALRAYDRLNQQEKRFFAENENAVTFNFIAKFGKAIGYDTFSYPDFAFQVALDIANLRRVEKINERTISD